MSSKGRYTPTHFLLIICSMFSFSVVSVRDVPATYSISGKNVRISVIMKKGTYWDILPSLVGLGSDTYLLYIVCDYP